MRHGQPDDLLLHMEGKHLLDGRLSPSMGQFPSVNQTEDALLTKSLDISSKTPVGEAGLVSVLLERSLLRHYRLNQFIAS
jgi:hypothetical protein